MALSPGRLATEKDDADLTSAGGGRSSSEKTALSLASRGVCASVVRIPPIVHGEGDKHSLFLSLVTFARQKGAAAYVGDGHNRWPAVHRLDIAHLFRLALESGEAGGRYHAFAEEGILFLDITEAIGRQLKLPVVSIEAADAGACFNWLASFVATDNPVSSVLTREFLGWWPMQPELIPDIEAGYYFNHA